MLVSTVLGSAPNRIMTTQANRFDSNLESQDSISRSRYHVLVACPIASAHNRTHAPQQTT
jgi:hypothetical protein